MILDNKMSFTITSSEKKLNVESKIFLEKYAMDGIYYENYYGL